MVWSEPRVWIDGPFLLADQMNAVSDNLRETAPAKAREPGDIFYALRRNEIGRLALGPAGTYLTPGVAAPQWAAVPSPITMQGDLVIGNSGGTPVRYGAPDSGIHVLAVQDGVVTWENNAFFDDWWTRDIWWSEEASKDLVMGAGNYYLSHILARNITMSGAINLRSPVTVIRCKALSLGSNVTIRSEPASIEDPIASTLLTGGGAGGSGTAGADGGDGLLYCGGGGEAGAYRSIQDVGDFPSVGRDGGDATGSFSATSFARALLGNALSQGGSGANSNHRTGGSPGGAVVIACNSLSLSGRSLSIDASGSDGAGREAGTGSGGGGGGLVAVIAKAGVPSINVDVSGGNGGSAHVNRANTSGGAGGDGTRYLATSFPS